MFSFSTITKKNHSARIAPLVSQRITVLPGSEYRLPRQTLQVKVISGTAWITASKEDIVLETSQTIRLQASQHPAIISSATRQTMIFELSSISA